MRKSLLLFLLLVALSAGLLAGACAAVQGRRETVSYRTEPLAGDPTAADGVELTWVSTCGYHLFWHSTFPAAAPEEAETRFSYSGQKQSWIIELDEDVLELSPGLNFLDIAPDQSLRRAAGAVGGALRPDLSPARRRDLYRTQWSHQY